MDGLLLILALIEYVMGYVLALYVFFCCLRVNSRWLNVVVCIVMSG
jgi:hypothetical protein